MSRTNGPFQQKTGAPDGWCVLPPTRLSEGIAAPLGGLATAAGVVSYNFAASKTATLFGQFDIPNLRTGAAPFLQEQFGTAAGVAGPSGVANTGDPDSGPAPFFPPFLSGVSFKPAAGFVAKGIKPTSIRIFYTVGVAAITTLTIALQSLSFVNNAAVPTPVNILAATALTLTNQANVYDISTAILPANQNYVITQDTYLQAVVSVVTSATGTLNIYGINLGYTFNYN